MSEGDELESGVEMEVCGCGCGCACKFEFAFAFLINGFSDGTRGWVYGAVSGSARKARRESTGSEAAALDGCMREAETSLK